MIKKLISNLMKYVSTTFTHMIPFVSVCANSTGKLGFDPDIWNNKLKLSGYVEEAYLTTVPKVPKNPVAGFSKMAE